MREKKYIIPVRPIPWQRVGVNHVERKFFDKQKKEKLNVAIYLTAQHGAEPFFIVPSIEIINYFKYGPRTKIDKKSFPYYNKSPDGDNCEKFYLDAMKGIIYKDDANVVKASWVKMWSDKDQVEIIVKELGKTHDTKQPNVR